LRRGNNVVLRILSKLKPRKGTETIPKIPSMLLPAKKSFQPKTPQGD
jgi:hypothetical protein